MANYAVFLEGNDFEFSRGGSKELLGFFVTVRRINGVRLN
jgi:hypothetical protein